VHGEKVSGQSASRRKVVLSHVGDSRAESAAHSLTRRRATEPPRPTKSCLIPPGTQERTFISHWHLETNLSIVYIYIHAIVLARESNPGLETSSRAPP